MSSPGHSNCDWDQKREVVFSKIDSIQGDIKVQTEDIKCLQKKISELQGDMKVTTNSLGEIRKDIDTIKTELRDQGTRNSTKLNKLDVNIGQLQTSSKGPYMVAGLISAIIAGVAALIKAFA